MSDAFSDLWKTTSSSGASQQTIAQQQQQKLSTTSAPTTTLPPWAQKATKSDAFSVLAASSTPSRTATPARPSNQPGSSSVGKAGGGGDAFSDLVGFGKPGTGSSSSMSLAAQQARATTPLLRESKPASSSAAHDALWDFDSLATTTSRAAPPAASSDSDPWDFLSAPAPAAAKSYSAPSSTSAVQQVSSSSSSPSIVFDLLDDLHHPPSKAPSQSQLRPSPRPTRSGTPNSFDFEPARAVESGENSDDDILGMLSKPVQPKPQRKSPTPSVSYLNCCVGRSMNSAHQESRPSTRVPTAPASRRSSPPPHVIGQIVEMGFSVEQARVALAATTSGDDVQAALETLLGQPPATLADTAPRDSQSDSEEERERERERARRHAQRRRGPQQEPQPPSRTSSQTESGQPLTTDKLIATASDFGLSVFSRANALWNQGKERVQKVYEEQMAAEPRPSSSASGRLPPGGNVAGNSGRPRWMQTDGEGAPQSPEHSTAAVGFKDSSDDEAPEEAAPPPRASRPSKAPAVQSTTAQVPAQPATSARHLIFDETQAPASYVSPRRRPQQAGLAAAPSPARRPSPAAPAMPPAPTMPVASGSALSAAAQHKSKANESFKLGSYPTAITAYSSALEVLPAGHMARVPLLTNRALASIRIGEWKSALEDCDNAISMIQPGGSGALYLGSVSGSGTNIEGETLYLGDALLKALSRRAAAREMGEKWPEALADWEEVNRAATLPMTAAPGADVGKVRAEATRGTERCRKMIGIVANGAHAASTSASEPAAAPKRPPPRRKVNPLAELSDKPSEAVQRLRAANAAAANEDAEKSALKDTVDMRLASWRAGKENNVRALLASLDSVLWPELGWQTVGMAELISPKQLKVRYMKAIAKLHPDKLNVTNTTVEQRMIANGVFATLNDAWIAAGA